jgi:hypothetical protein
MTGCCGPYVGTERVGRWCGWGIAVKSGSESSLLHSVEQSPEHLDWGRFFWRWASRSVARFVRQVFPRASSDPWPRGTVSFGYGNEGWAYEKP